MVAEIQSGVRGPQHFRRLWRNARVATLAADSVGLGLVEDAAIACRADKIDFVGPESALPAEWRADEVIDCAGRLITPGLVDCHTHLVYAGDRATEFERRLNGESYESIARSGGGIVSTVRATRAASEAQLIAAARPRLEALRA
jgi:imidazolonepropionase